MKMVLMILLLMTMCMAIFYRWKLEEVEERLEESEEMLGNCQKIFKEINDEIVEKPHLNSAKNLQNKLKTILKAVKHINIEFNW